MQQTRARPRRVAGFTLVELMLAVLIVGVLAAVALPSFQGSIRKSRRSDAFNAINAVQQAQERMRANHQNYCLLGAPSGGDCGLNMSSTSTNGHYSISIQLGSDKATGYVVTATAAGGQAADTSCAVLAGRMDRGALSYGSGSSSPDWADANRCWAK